MFESTHPADDARMRAMLLALRLFDCFKNDADTIKRAWQEFTATMGYKAEPEYFQCYPDTHLVRLVSRAKDGVKGIGTRFADARQEGQVRSSSMRHGSSSGKRRSPFSLDAAKVGELRGQAA